jgi:hypothetical protein
MAISISPASAAPITTPKKPCKIVNVSPTTKSCNCVICYQKIDNADYRRKLFRGGNKTDACSLLERSLGLEIDFADSSRTNIVCRHGVQGLQKCEDHIIKKKREFQNTSVVLRSCVAGEVISMYIWRVVGGVRG